jgi:hypothetical protein
MSVTTSELNQILDNADQLTDGTSFIDTAEAIISSTSASSYYDADHLDKMRLWLAAHLACAKLPPKTGKKTGKSSESYQQVLGTGLNSTRYGQVFKMLDYKGYILRRSKPVTIKAMGYTA